MSRDLAALQPRITRQDRLGERRAGIIPERRDTRAPELRPSGDMRSASRGDGGAQELMRTLGLIQRGTESLAEYAEKRHEKRVEDDTAKGAIDQASGNVDVDLEKRSVAYRNSVALGRTMTGYQSGLHDLDERVRTVIENQDDPDLNVRQDEVRAIIDQHFTDFAIDPETGKLRPFLASPASQRWLAGAIREGRAKAEAGSLSRIEERFNGEALTHFGTLFDAQLEAGEVDIAALREILPPTLNEDAIRGVIISTVMAKAQSLRSAGRREESSRLLASLLEADAPAPTDRDDPEATAVPEGTPAPPAASPSSSTAAAKPATPRRISFVTLASAVMHVESRGNPGAVSPKGARGTMQTMPGTLRDPGFGVKPAANDTPAELERVGRDYLRAMLKRYDGNYVRALAAYNAGPGNVDKWIAANPRMSDEDFVARIPFKETQDYVGDVLTRAGAGGNSAPATAERFSDPDFQADPEPLDPIELAKRTPGPSLLGQLTGGLALRPEERRKLLDYREQMNTEMRGEWRRERREKQDENHGVFMERLSGLGQPLTPEDIADARKRGDITPEATVQLLNTIRADRDRAEAEAERTDARDDRDRDERERNEAEGITATIMGPVYSGTRSPGQASQLFNERAADLNPRVRRMVLGAVNSELSGVENLRKNNPRFVAAAESVDDSIERMVANLPPLYRGRKADGTPFTKTRPQMEAEIRLDGARWSRRIAQQAINTGDVGNLAAEARNGLQTKYRAYYTPMRRR